VQTGQKVDFTVDSTDAFDSEQLKLLNIANEAMNPIKIAAGNTGAETLTTSVSSKEPQSLLHRAHQFETLIYSSPIEVNRVSPSLTLALSGNTNL
jgi:hypothetical protein